MYRAEVHKIVTADADAVVLDFNFDESKLDDEARAKYRQALSTLAIPITEGSPLDFAGRNAMQPLAAAMMKRQKYIIQSDDVPEVAAEAGVSERVALQLASAYNARQLVQIQPGYLVARLMEHPADIFVDNLEVDGERQDVPVNLEYVQRYLREAHIVGVKQPVKSSTLGRNITSVSFFDLEKTMTQRSLDAERQAMQQKLGVMATTLSDSMRSEVQQNQPLLRVLEDAHAKPDKLVAVARMVEGYDAIFDADAGNWEGFTVGEHTETVLRNFDENFADRLPVEFLAPMRLAILGHDLGKPLAAARGERRKQKEYNVTQANDFFTKVGVDEKLKDLLVAVAGDGAELAFYIQVRGAGEPAQMAMRELAIRTLREFYGTEEISDDQISGFIEMCNILQICDGGAYTSMAVTTRTGGRGRYRNAPSFNASFAQPVGFGRRGIRLRKAGEVEAADDLTPQTTQSASRLKITRAGAGRRAPRLSTHA